MEKIQIFGPLESDECLQQIQVCAQLGYKACLMADHHIGYSMPIGGVVAYEEMISPSGVGFDIGCGNKAVMLDIDYHFVKDNIESIMDQISARISFGVGRVNNERVDAEILETAAHPAWKIPAIHALREKAVSQLGTVGSGNHYVDIFADELKRIWIGCHFGSRGLGHSIASHYLRLCGSSDRIMAPATLIPTSTDLGREYIMAMDLAGRYAYAGRDYVCSKVATMLGASIIDSVHNHHNYAWQEQHDGRQFWVVRKGATPAFPGQRGFVGGSMGDDSVILKGKDSEQSRQALYSTVHGAGRIMSRTKAAGKRRWSRDIASGKKVSKTEGGAVSRKMMNDWVVSRGVVLRGAGTDESPHCYKRLNQVLSYHSDSIEIEHILTPLGVAMAGESEFDPYRD